MKVHCAPCPNCSRSFHFPVEYCGNSFQLVCPNCRVGYDLLQVDVSVSSLNQLFASHRAAPVLLKPWYSERIFRYLTALLKQIVFAEPEPPNAIIFLVSQTRSRSRIPLAIFFQHTYSLVQPLNRLLFSASLAVVGALLLLQAGLSLIPVLIGTLLAEICFTRFTRLPKVKGETRKRLQKEQRLLQQCYQWQSSRYQVSQDQVHCQSLLALQQEAQPNPVAAPEYELKEGAEQTIRCLKDYLSLCDRAIQQYEAAIRSVVIQIETSKLSVELSSQGIDPQIELGLERLEAQLAQSTPQQTQYDPNHGTTR